MTLPKRAAEVIEQHLGGELLAYHPETHHVFALGPIATRVWRACDGVTQIRNLVQAMRAEGIAVDRGEIIDIVERLIHARMVVTDADESVTRGSYSRRNVLAAGGALLGVIAVIAPTAAMAASCAPSGGICSSSSACCSGTCTGDLVCL